MTALLDSLLQNARGHWTAAQTATTTSMSLWRMRSRTALQNAPSPGLEAQEGSQNCLVMRATKSSVSVVQAGAQNRTRRIRRTASFSVAGREAEVGRAARGLRVPRGRRRSAPVRVGGWRSGVEHRLATRAVVGA